MNRTTAMKIMDAFLSLSQTQRLMQLSFPYGDGPSAMLVVKSLRAEECLSGDFVYRVDLYSDDPHIPLKTLNGKLMSIALERSDQTKRYFTGYVFQSSCVDSDGGLATYSVELRPWLAFTEKRQNNFIFHNKTLEERTKMIFTGYAPFSHWEMGLIKDGDLPRTDSIQYDETDYNYLHRHWEEMGWYYWYEHTEKGHKLKLSDYSPVAKPIDGDENVLYQYDAGSTSEDTIQSLKPSRQLASTEFTILNFNFKQPKPTSQFIETRNKQGLIPKMEIYQDAGLYSYKNNDDGAKIARHRMEQIEAAAKQFKGASVNPYLQPGRTFTLDNAKFMSQTLKNSEDDLNFLLISVTHTASNNFDYQNGNVQTRYQNTFTCLRRKIPWRPSVEHAKKILAPQTALVVGPAGQEIHTDEYGRIRVQFHWDREGGFDERSSAWIRVSSGWAGTNFGEMALPRVGQEVIVHFINGNPDRPVVTGRVYNHEQMPPWELPSQKALMGVRSKELGGQGFNNLTFDDTTSEIQLQLSTTMLLTQLNMGHITRIEGTPGRKDFRGEGFELRTDGHGVVRAGKGMYISTDIRAKATERQRDISEAIAQLEKALDIAKSLQKSAKAAQALAPDVDDQEQQKNTVYDEDLKKAGLLMSSPEGIAITTPKSAQVSAEKNMTVTTWESFDVSAMKDVRVSAKDSVSVFAAEKPLYVVAGKEKLRMQANKNQMELFAKKKLAIASISNKTEIAGKSKVLATSGGAFVDISNGMITLAAPGLISIKCAGFSVCPPAGSSYAMPSFNTEPVCLDCLRRAAKSGAALVAL